MSLLKGQGVDDELCKIIDYIGEENLTYRKRHGTLRDLTNKERLNLSSLARRIRKPNFESICTIFKPETVIGWYKRRYVPLLIRNKIPLGCGVEWRGGCLSS